VRDVEEQVSSLHVALLSATSAGATSSDSFFVDSTAPVTVTPWAPATERPGLFEKEARVNDEENSDENLRGEGGGPV